MQSIMPQAMAPAYFFYNTDASGDRQQPRHLVPQPHPHAFQQQMTVFPVVPTLPSTPMPATPVYSRPGSSCSQPPVHPKIFSNMPLALTPQASPQLLSHKPTIVLDTDVSEVDVYYPSTPPLSSSGSSVISSPGSCDILQTPLNPMFSGLDGFENKECGVDQLESFPILDWSSCASPPMTPVYLQSQTPAPRLGSLNNNNTPDLLSCPSLSPSPPPFARSSSQDIDFCDPRNLTVGSVNSTLAPEFSALPALSAADQEDHKFVRGEALKAEPPIISPSPSFDFNSTLQHFDELDDLESGDDFVNGLVNLQPARSRASSAALSLGHSSFSCDDDIEDFESSFGVDYLPSPVDSSNDSDAAHPCKRVKMEPSVEPVMQSAADSQQQVQEQSQQQQTTPVADSQSTDSVASEPKNGGSESNSVSDNAPATPIPAPANRRGRKQSLTEDPSKTFVCDLCNRRFRRQEHLKRHYRSLHTQDKPFECSDCGKKFSRSDNLAQHARTHGSGAIIMGVIDDPDAMAHAMHHQNYHHMMGVPHMAGGEDYNTLGKVLFQMAAEIPGSGSDNSSDEGSDSSSKKRKRSE